MIQWGSGSTSNSNAYRNVPLYESFIDTTYSVSIEFVKRGDSVDKYWIGNSTGEDTRRTNGFDLFLRRTTGLEQPVVFSYVAVGRWKWLLPASDGMPECVSTGYNSACISACVNRNLWCGWLRRHRKSNNVTCIFCGGHDAWCTDKRYCKIVHGISGTAGSRRRKSCSPPLNDGPVRKFEVIVSLLRQFFI